MALEPLFSFCISTFKRPHLLKQQVTSLLSQTYTKIEIVICDNDSSSNETKTMLESFGDDRIRYYQNETNLGMIKSFNRALDLANGLYVTPVTDDDPIVSNFIDEIKKLIDQFPDYGLYAGFLRSNKTPYQIEVIEKNKFINEFLDWNKTISILWSSCTFRKECLIEIGKIPDFGSPHLADHGLIALVGNRYGGVITNKMFSEYIQHKDNFSKGNLEMYFIGCKGFYETMSQHAFEYPGSKETVIAHLQKWFISLFFYLKKYYTYSNPSIDKIKVVDKEIKKILALDFMKSIIPKYYFKNTILKIKGTLGLIKKYE